MSKNLSIPHGLWMTPYLVKKWIITYLKPSKQEHNFIEELWYCNFHKSYWHVYINVFNLNNTKYSHDFRIPDNCGNILWNSNKVGKYADASGLKYLCGA